MILQFHITQKFNENLIYISKILHKCLLINKQLSE